MSHQALHRLAPRITLSPDVLIYVYGAPDVLPDTFQVTKRPLALNRSCTCYFRRKASDVGRHTLEILRCRFTAAKFGGNRCQILEELRLIHMSSLASLVRQRRQVLVERLRRAHDLRRLHRIRAVVAAE